MDLTLKQRKFIKYYLESGNATEAAKKSYDCSTYESAAQVGYENLKKLDFTAFLEEAGLTDKSITDTIREGLTANRTISANVVIKSDNPKVKTKSATARDVDFIDVPDYAVRHKYLETLIKLKNRMPADKHEFGGPNGEPIQITVYGQTDPLYGYITKSTSFSTHTGDLSKQEKISSDQLAPESTEDNNSNSTTS